MKNMAGKFFGVTRFSVYFPSSNAWKISSASEDEYLSHLYSDERLAVRFDIFEKYALPVYQIFYDQYEYKHILFYSKEMPEKWKNILFELEKKYPFIVTCEVGEKIDYKGVIRSLLYEDNSDCVVVVFRVDDDDFLSDDYIEQLSFYAKKEFIGMSVSFTSGIAAKYKNEVYCDFREVRKPLIAIGLADIGFFNYKNKELILPNPVIHSDTDKYRPVILDSRKSTFIWSHHSLQDTNQNHGSVGKNSRIDRSFYEKKVLDNSSIIQRFSTLKSEFYDALNKNNEIISFNDIDILGEVKLGDVKIKEGVYRIFYDIEFYSKDASDLKGFIFYIKSNQLEYTPGLTLSQNKNIGWYRYLPVFQGQSKGFFDFCITEEAEFSNVYVNKWSLSGDAKIKKLSVEEIGLFGMPSTRMHH